MSYTALANTFGTAFPTAQGPVTGVILIDSAGNPIASFGSDAMTSGGCTSYSFISAGAVKTQAVKASAGQLYGLQFFNNSGSIAYGRIYDMATAPGTGDSASILLRFLVPANTSGAGFVMPMPNGVALECLTGIGLRVTGGAPDNDATALSNTVLGNVLFK